MESIVLSMISSYLKVYVNNFRKEQISMNFLRGQGVIKDLDINVDAINEAVFQNGMPGLKFSRILINKLSIEAPIMSLKTKPIVVFIDELFVEITEVTDILKKPKENTSTNAKKASAKYGFMDRIVDSVTFQINHIFVGLRTLGKIKTTEIGPWTPPVLLIELSGNRFFNVNHNGVECELEECFRIRQTKRSMLFIYKKFESRKVSMYLVEAESWFQVVDEILSPNKLVNRDFYSYIKSRDTKNPPQYYSDSKTNRIFLKPKSYLIYRIIDNIPFEILLCMRKRIDNNVLLGLEISFNIDTVNITTKQFMFKELMNLLISLSYCILRKDAIEELYGSDPHQEKVNNNNNSCINSSNINSISGVNKISREQLGQEEKETLDQLESEAMFSAKYNNVAPDKDASGGGASSTGNVDWQRSTLNSDVDPPHLRLVIVAQINKAVVKLSFDELIDETAAHNNNNSSNKNNSKHSGRNHTNNSTNNKHLKDNHHSSDHTSDHNSGVILTTSGLVYSSIWPEHAAATESMMQISMKYFSVQEYSGSVLSTIIRVKQSLDEMISSRVNNSESGARSGSFDNPSKSHSGGIGDDNKKNAAQNVPNIALQPRGVKEVGDRDLEILPGICLLYRKDANWPPPPIHLGVSISSEIALCPIVVAAVNVEVLCKLRLFIEGAWDKRWTTGDWDLSETAHQNIRVEGMHGAVSSNMVITLCSVDVMLYPSLQCASAVNKRLRQQIHNSGGINNSSGNRAQRNSSGGGSAMDSSGSSVLDNSLILPTLVTVSIGQSTLTWKHTLEFSLLPYLFNSSSANNINSSININVKAECDTFPHSKSDLTSVLILNNSLSVAKNSVLICPRFDAQIAGVTVSISNDNVSHISAVNSKNKQNKHQSAGREHNTPHVNKIIQIAQLSHFSSLDPHPHREQDQLSENLQSYANANPYDREYYWKSGQSMIRSSGVSVLDVLVDVSLLDTIKMTESVYQYQTVIEHYNRMSVSANRVGSNKSSVEVTNLGSTINDNYVSSDGTAASSDQAQQSTEPELNELLLLTDQPSTVNIFHVSNVHINVLKDSGRAQKNTFDATINTTAIATTSNTIAAPTIVEIKLHSGCVVFEQTSADTSDISNLPDDRALRDRNPVIKGTVSEISIISGAQSILSVSLPATEQHNVDPSDDLNAGNRIHGNSSGSIAQFRVESVWEDTHVSGDHCANSNAADGCGDKHNLDADVNEILRRNNVTVGSTAIGTSVPVSDTAEVVTTQSAEDVTSSSSNVDNDSEALDAVTVVLRSVDESINHSVGDAFPPNVTKDTIVTQKKLCKQVSIQVTPSVLCTADISPVEAAMKTVLSELLTGSGSIHPTTTNIWDDSILGYFKRIVRKAMHFSPDSGDKETERSEKYTSDNAGNNTSVDVATSDAIITTNNSSDNESDYSIAVDVKLPHFTFSVMDVDSPSTLSLEWTNLILHSYKESPHTPVWSVSLVTMLCMYISKVTIDSHSLKIENEVVPLVENFSFSTAFSNYEVHKDCADSAGSAANGDIVDANNARNITAKKQFDPAALFIQSNTLLSQFVSCCSYEDVLTVSQLCTLLLRRVSSIQGLVNIFHETTGRSAGKVDRHKKLLNNGGNSSNSISIGDRYNTSSNSDTLTSQLVSTAVEVAGTVNQMTDSRHLMAHSADHYTALMQLFDLQYSNNSSDEHKYSADGSNDSNDGNSVYSSNNSGREQQVTQIDSYKQYIRTEMEILLHLQKEFNIIYHNLAGIEKRHNDGTVRSGADSAQNLLMFSEVKTSLEKMQQAYNYYSGQVPVYCGWTNNSGGFVRSDKSGLAQRSWTSLVQGTLYFLSQPYSNQITNEIALDMSGANDAHSSHTSSVAAYTVVDPDHSEHFTSNKAALTTRIFICPALPTDSHSHNTTSSSLFGSSSSSHGSGGDSHHMDPSKVYIITCDSLDEKLAWLDALEPWLVSSSATSASTDTKRISIFRRNSHKSILSSLTPSPAKSNNSAATSDDGSSGGKPTLGDKKSSFKFFSSFTKSKAKPALTSVAENNTAIADSDILGTIPTSGSNSCTSHALNQNTGTYEDSSGGTLDDQFLREYIAQSERSNELTRSEDGAMSSQIKDTQRFVAEAVLLLNSLILTAKKTSKILHEAESLGTRSLSSVLSELRDQKERNRQLESQCAQARSAEAELNFVLQACTMQHINTVQEMATRMDNIMMKYNTLRGATANKGAASTAYGGSSGTNIHELVEHLTVAVGEKDRLLRECDAKLNMTEQEMLSQQVEARSAHKELQSLQVTHAKFQESSQQEIRALSELCRVEGEVRQSVERERDEYKLRYEQLLSNFVALGLKAPTL